MVNGQFGPKIEENIIIRVSSSRAAITVNCIKISEIMQVTRGTFGVALLSFKRSS